MKYESPKYELSLLEPRDILMSGEVQMNQTSENSADFIINAGSLFQYFD